MEFEGKRALVTGGSSGIGAMTVELLVQRGARVVAAGTSEEKLAGLCRRLGPSVIPFAADIGDQLQAEAMVEGALASLGGLDILINNAGTGGVLKRTGDLDPADWRRAMAINLDAVFWASRIALPHLVASGGCIVNTASLAGLGADYAFTTYNVSKAALIALTKCMALDYASDGVRVNCISPGFVATGLNAKAPAALAQAYVKRTPMGRAGSAAEIAEAILFLAGPKASYISGHNLIVDGATMAHTGLPNIPELLSQLTP